MGFRVGVKLTPPSVSWFSCTPGGIGLNSISIFEEPRKEFIKKNVLFEDGNNKLYQRQYVRIYNWPKGLFS